MKKAWSKIVSMVLVLSTLLTALPIGAYADAGQAQELYIKSLQLARADSREEAKEILEGDGYIFLDANLNQGTGEDGIWLGYTTTTDPEEAIYDLKLMNMKGGFTLTSMKEALAAQEAAFAQMATDLKYLVDEFILAYEEGSVPAQKAYKALNFFRVVENETQPEEKNGLGYQIVSGNMSLEKLTEMLLLCDSGLVDGVIKLLTAGIGIRNGNWMKKLSEMGPYDYQEVYYKDEDEEEFKRRAEQLLPVLQLYSQAYNAMDLSGLIPDKLDENFEAEYTGAEQKGTLSADDAAVKKLDESRYKIYKVVFDELAKYSFGTNRTLKDFFCSLENDGSTRDLYPLVAVLSDGEFAALSYGCFLDIALGATATLGDLDSYDDLYDSLTQEVKSVYLYHGVEDVLFEDDTVIGFTEAANRHMASTGELEFYEKESTAEDIWETGKNAAILLGCSAMAIVAVAKITAGVSMGIAAIASATGAALAKSTVLAGVIKVATAIGGPIAMLAAVGAALVVALGAFIVSVIVEEINGKIHWDKNPMPEYLYDVKEVGFSQTSVNEGIATEYIKKPVFSLYKAVTDSDGQVVDLNARSGDASQWIALYASYDRQGTDAKPIRAQELLVKTGNGQTPEGYLPLTLFGQVAACNLNQWDEDDDVNGVYLFYGQDQAVQVDDGKTYYVYDVYLQSGESDTHCIELLKAAGYTPLNINLSPDLTDGDVVFRDKTYTYLGYKTTTNKASAIRDIRMVYGPSQGQIQFGAATYVDSGSNGKVTLYSTKYESAGTPLLAGGLVCVNDPSQVPAGYEPICVMSGGPAVSFNINTAGRVFNSERQTLLYFLPETTFTHGKKYIGDIAYLHMAPISTPGRPGTPGSPRLPQWVEDYWKSSYLTRGGSLAKDRVAFYITHNPYRGIYDVKAAVQKNLPDTFLFGGTGYTVFNRIACSYAPGESTTLYNEYGSGCQLFAGDKMNAILYLSGNPNSTNRHQASTNQMSGVQPLLAGDVLCSSPYQGSGYEYTEPQIPKNYEPITNVFSDSKEPAVILHENGERKYKFYMAKTTEPKPYISDIFVADELSLFRANGGYEQGLKPTDVTETLLFSQLASVGATNFCGGRISIEHSPDGVNGYEVNALKFGYKRTDDSTLALRDVFLYFNKFSTDAPPKELYRGTVTYKLICEIPYNMTGYDKAPKPGVYLYGTTNQKAGEPITEFEVSTTPFMEGYRTVRTMEGRSLFGQIKDYLKQQKEAHPMSTGKSLYNHLNSFFSLYQADSGYFYLHTKRQGEELGKEKPYVGQIYITTEASRAGQNLEDLFDQGAEAALTVDLNQGACQLQICEIYLGYSYTADPSQAIRDLRAYHEKNPPATLTENGCAYWLVKDQDLNKDAGGDYIYLYATRDPRAGDPVVSLSAGYDVVTHSGTTAWVDGSQANTATRCTKRWGTDSYSDLNRKAGGKYIYLMFTQVASGFVGTYTTIDYGVDKLYTRSDYTSKNPKGPYIGGLYVMDKNTILQEKIAAGTLAQGSTCDKITDAEVKDRLKAMGATVVVETPIQVTGATYFVNNTNKVFLGYSYTNLLRKAIRGIALKAEILSLSEPPASIEVGGCNYNLVAQAAKNVTSLPRAINLIGVENGQDLLIPRLYLYYSTTADNDPIYDITIDADPLKSGWLTAASANELDPFADISAQAQQQADLAYEDQGHEWGHGSNPYDVYSYGLYQWLADVSRRFDPAKEGLVPFYIHTNHLAGQSLEELKPYIGEVFVAVGDTRHAALTDMVQYGVDGFVDYNLNEEAGGRYVYLGYKRVARAEDALRDLVVFEGKDPEPSRRLDINGTSVKYTLVANVDLNSKAGGKWLYLYASDSGNTGNPIQSLRVTEEPVSYLECGVEEFTVKLAEEKAITAEDIDLNKGAGGKYLYLVMHRTTSAGHVLVQTSWYPTIIQPTCGQDGSVIYTYRCAVCGTKDLPEKVTVLPATGQHQDPSGDGDHRCDVCGAKDVTAHVPGVVQKENVKAPTCVAKGSYHAVEYCAECEDELRNTVLYTDIDPDNHLDGPDADHNCDRCGALNVKGHVPGEPEQINRVEPGKATQGSYEKVVRCKECKAVLSQETVILPALSTAKPENSQWTGSLFGSGSLVIITSFLGVALLAAGVVFVQKKKSDKKGNKENEG